MINQTLNHTEFLSADEIASQIHDGDTVAIGGYWFVRLPLTLIQALIRKNVKNLTVITQASGLAVEQLISAGLVKKVIYSFISLDLLGLAPTFRKACEEGEIEFEEWTALQMNTALEAARCGMPFGDLQPPVNSEFNRPSNVYQPLQDPLGSGKEIGFIKALRPDACLIHAQQADRNGNIAIFGGQGLDKLYIGASKRTFVSVEEVCDTFTQDSRGKIFPHFLISGICEAPFGAHPASCLPYYATDYDRLVESDYSPPDEEEKIFLHKCAEMTTENYAAGVQKLHLASGDKAGYTTEELMVCLMSDCLKNDMVTTVGSNTPIAFVAYLLAKRTHAPRCTLIPYCGLTDIPCGPISLRFSEATAFHDSTVHWGIEDLWQWIYQNSLTSVEFGGCAQLDRHGSINNSKILDSTGRLKVLLPGQAGLADILNLHQNAFYYVCKHDKRTLCDKVSWPGGSYSYVTMEERENQGLPNGIMRIISNLCIFTLNRESRELEVTSIHPGVTKEMVAEATGFPVRFSEQLCTSRIPTPKELALIRGEIDPFGYRRLEFSSGEERKNLIRYILEMEKRVLE